MHEADWISPTAGHLAALYDREFGGKVSGRYRIPDKLVRRIAGRRRLYEADILALSAALFELGYVLIDMDLSTLYFWIRRCSLRIDTDRQA